MPLSIGSETLAGRAEERSPHTMQELEHDLRSQLRVLVDDHFEEYRRLAGSVGMTQDQARVHYRKCVAQALVAADRALATEVAFVLAHSELS